MNFAAQPQPQQQQFAFAQQPAQPPPAFMTKSTVTIEVLDSDEDMVKEEVGKAATGALEPKPAATTMRGDPEGPFVLGKPASSSSSVAAGAVQVAMEVDVGGGSGSGFVPEESFDGAAGVAREKPKEHECEDCARTFALNHALALLYDSNEFAKGVESDVYMSIRKTQRETHSFKNLVDPSRVRLVCAWCCSKYHGAADYVETIVKESPTGEIVEVERVSSKF